MKRILINALCVGVMVLPLCAAFAAGPEDDKPASPRSLPTDNLPPFGMLDDNGHLVPVPSPAEMARAAGSEHPPAPPRAAAPGPSLALATEAARAAVDACAKQGVAIAAPRGGSMRRSTRIHLTGMREWAWHNPPQLLIASTGAP